MSFNLGKSRSQSKNDVQDSDTQCTLAQNVSSVKDNFVEVNRTWPESCWDFLNLTLGKTEPFSQQVTFSLFSLGLEITEIMSSKFPSTEASVLEEGQQ